MSLRKRLREWREKRQRRTRRLSRRAKAVERIQDHLARVRKRLREVREEKPETDGERERRADRIEALEARIEQLVEELAQARSRRRRARARLRRARRRVTHIRNRIALRRDYASPHFRYAEFDCRDGTPVPKAAYPALRHLCRNYLEPARQRYGPITSTSGYRTESYNRRIGGVENSVHIYDQHPDAVADDHYAAKVSPAELANFEDALDPGGLGRYSSFVHTDNRQRLGWAKARWSG